MTNYWIRSATSPNAFLRIDGSQVNSSNPFGSGTVNCQYYGPGSQPQNQAGNDEVFGLVPLGGTVFAIHSIASPNAYLRMDGSGVAEFNGNGSGIVNCQYYTEGILPQPAAGNDEAFELVSIPDSPVFAIRSFYYANAYLRIDGSGVTSYRGIGSGIVNCQYYDSTRGIQPTWTPGNSEIFYISGI